MFVIVTVLMVAVCCVFIGVGCWWPPRESALTVTGIQYRLAVESYCRRIESPWPARTETEADHELVLTRLHTIAATDAHRAQSRQHNALHR